MNWARVFVLAAATACMVSGFPLEARGQVPKSGGMTAEQKQVERKALRLFASGDYQGAVALYSELFADSRDPIYLRNIGRCYQRLKNPDRAISSFEEYLLKAKQITKEERQEIVGYISLMERLKAEQTAAKEAAAPASALPTGPPAAPPPSFPVDPQAPRVEPALDSQMVIPPAAGPATAPEQAQGDASLALSEPPVPARDANAGIRWVGKGALAFAAVMAMVSGALLWSSWSKYSDAENGKCLPDGCSSAADSITSRNLVSQITFGLAAASAIAGGVVLILYPATPSSSGLSAGVGFTY